MGKITISADTPDEFLATVQLVFGVTIADAAGVVTAPAPAQTRQRKTKAEAPAPIQPGAQVPPAGQPQPIQQPIPAQPIPQSPISAGQPQQPPQQPPQQFQPPPLPNSGVVSPFVPPQQAQQPPQQASNVTSLYPPGVLPNGGQQHQMQPDRPSVAKMRGHIGALVQAYGEPHVHRWVQQAFALAGSISLAEFLQNTIHHVDDGTLEDAYARSGGR